MPRFQRERLISAAVWLAVAVWVGWAAVRAFGLERGFPLVAMIAFTPQVAAASVGPLILALALRRWAAAAVAGLCVLILALCVLPRAFGGPSEAEGGEGATVNVLASNAELGEGTPEAIVALVEDLDVDLLSLEELTPGLAGKLDRAGLRRLLPFRELSLAEGSFGSGLYARERLIDAETTTLPGGFPLISAVVRAAGASPIEVTSVHIQPPTDFGATEWSEDLRALPGASEATPRVLAGDFNATLDHAAFRNLLDRGYDDAAATLGAGLEATWPIGRRFPPAVAIDHVLADRRIGVAEFSTHEVPRSDHRAVFAELVLPAAN